MKKSINVLLASVLGFAFITGCNNSSNNLDLNSHSTKEVQDVITKEFPMIQPSSLSIEKNKDLNLWQVYAMGNVMYITPDLKYFIGGHYFKFGGDKTDLTQQWISEKDVVDVKSLPLNLAIKTQHGKGDVVFYVFSDPECPYCHMLQSEVINKLDNATVYTFLYPLPMHQNAYGDAVKLLCNKNSSQAFESWMTISPQTQESLHDKYFANMKDCQEGKEKVDSLLKLGQALNIMSTPTIINVQGKKIGMKELADLSKQESSVQKVSVGK